MNIWAMKNTVLKAIIPVIATTATVRNLLRLIMGLQSLIFQGMSTRDIEEHLRAIYGIDVSPSLVSQITDRIMPYVSEWQSRPPYFMLCVICVAQ